MLLDSNIIIYSAVPEYISLLSPYTSNEQNAASLLTKVEVLGFHRLQSEDKERFQRVFSSLSLIPIDVDTIEQAIELRSQKKMSLGDAVIAATAVQRELPLVTRNTKDFDWIDDLELVNPFVVA